MMNCLIIAGLVVTNIGWLIILYFVVKCHLETKSYSESDLMELKDIINLKEIELCRTMNGYKEAIIDKTTSNIWVGINGLANRLDYIGESIEEYAHKVNSTSEQQLEETISEKDDIDWTDFMENTYGEACPHEYRHDPKPKLYHNQNVKIGNQTEERLRDLIDNLWQRAHSHESDLSENDYEELALIHRNISAMLIKAHRGMWKESTQTKFDV